MQILFNEQVVYRRGKTAVAYSMKLDSELYGKTMLAGDTSLLFKEQRHKMFFTDSHMTDY